MCGKCGNCKKDVKTETESFYTEAEIMHQRLKQGQEEIAAAKRAVIDSASQHPTKPVNKSFNWLSPEPGIPNGLMALGISTSESAKADEVTLHDLRVSTKERVDGESRASWEEAQKLLNEISTTDGEFPLTGSAGVIHDTFGERAKSGNFD